MDGSHHDGRFKLIQCHGIGRKGISPNPKPALKVESHCCIAIQVPETCNFHEIKTTVHDVQNIIRWKYTSVCEVHFHMHSLLNLSDTGLMGCV